MVRVYRYLIAVTLAVTLGCGTAIGRLAAQTPKESPLAGVPLPDAPLDLRSLQMPVSDFLRFVSLKAASNSAAQVKLNASSDASIERISVFTKQMPVRKVLANVATLYGWDWSIERGRAGDNDVLILGPSTKRKKWEQRRWDALMDNAFLPVLENLGAERETNETRERAAKAAFQAAKDPEQRDLREMEYTARKAGTAATRFLSTLKLTRYQKQQLLEQVQVQVPWSQLTPLQRDLAITVAMPFQFSRSNFSDAGNGWDKIPTKGERERFASELVSRLVRMGVTLSVKLEPVTGVALGLRVGNGSASVPDANGLRKFEESLPPVRGNPYITLDLETPAEREDVSDNPTAEMRDGAYTELENTPFPDKLALVPEDTWSDVVSKLARLVDRPIFSDGYIAARGIRPLRNLDGSIVRPLSMSADGPLARPESLASGLDLLCRAYNMVWWQQNGTLFFRSRTWLMERRYEVPVAIRKILLTQIRNLPQNGVQDHNSTALLQTLSGLRLPQLQGLSATGKPGEEIKFFIPKEDRLQNSVISHRFLGFFNSLIVEQQRSALSTSGLTLRAMREDQQAAFVNVVVSERGWRTVLVPDRLRFSVEVLRLPDLRRERFEGQASAASIQFHFTSDTNTTAPYFFAVALAEERPQSAEHSEADP